jgi:hypothetical protein
MPAAQHQEFADAWFRAGCSPQSVAEMLGLNVRGVYERRNKAEIALGVSLPSVSRGGNGGDRSNIRAAYHRRHELKLRDGVAVVFSDAHWWPGKRRTVAHAALLRLLPRLKPRAVIANGDVFDGAAMSRHDAIGWSQVPSAGAEIEVLQANMNEIQDAAPDAALLRTIGNHDIRFDKYLAIRASEMKDVSGSRLRDHLPRWLESWSVQVNGDLMIKHRWHNGVHATWNNTLKGGVSIVTGHLHRLMVTPFTDYRGRRYGIDTGTLADAVPPPPMEASQFDYAEDNPLPWGSGFVVLTWHNGLLLPPEICEVIGGKAWFRGEAIA